MLGVDSLESTKGTVSMLRLPISRGGQRRTADPAPSDGDRAMDVLQYVTAGLALLVVVLLAVLR
jgi:hypothetical protein